MIDEFLRSILPTNRPRSRGDGRGALWAMYDLVPDSTFSFKRGGEKSSEKCASRDHYARLRTAHDMDHDASYAVASSAEVIRGDRDHQRPGSIPPPRPGAREGREKGDIKRDV